MFYQKKDLLEKASTIKRFKYSLLDSKQTEIVKSNTKH